MESLEITSNPYRETLVEPLINFEGKNVVDQFKKFANIESANNFCIEMTKKDINFKIHDFHMINLDNNAFFVIRYQKTMEL